MPRNPLFGRSRRRTLLVGAATSALLAALTVTTIIDPLHDDGATTASTTPNHPSDDEAAEAKGERGEEAEAGAGEEGEEEGGEAEEAEEAEKRKGRDDYFWKQRTYPTGKLPNGAWSRARRQAALLSTSAVAATDPLPWTAVFPQSINAANLSWVYGGSTPYSGRITSIATHPTNAQVAWIGTAQGGVWKTADGGSSWTPIFESQTVLGSMAIGAVAVDPGNPNRLFVGTGEANGDGTAYFGAGLYRTDNGGGSWQKVGGTKFDGCAFTTIAIQPGQSGVVLAGVLDVGGLPGDGRYGPGCLGRTGMWRSDDGGTGWTQLFTASPMRAVFAPNNPAVVYTSLRGFGVYKSIDSGLHWGILGAGVLPTSELGVVEVTAVASGTLSNSQTLYAAFASNNPDLEILGIYRSDNGGTSWYRLAEPKHFIYGVKDNGFCKGQCNYDLALAADPANPDKLYAAGVYFNVYTNNTPQLQGIHNPGTAGCPYTGTVTNCIHVDFHAMSIDANRRLWVGSDGGIYRTTDGVTFANLNSRLNLIQLYPGTSGSLSAPPLVGGAQDNATTRYTSGTGGTLIGAGDGGYSAVLGPSRNIVLATSQKLQVSKVINGTPCPYSYRDDYGITERGLDYVTPFISVLVGSPVQNATAYAGSSRVYKTTNATTGCGQTVWSPASQYFTYTSGTSTYRDLIYSIAPARDGSTVYAGTYSGKVYITGGSTTWAPRSSGLPGRTVTDIWVHPTNPAVAYATTSGFNTDSVAGGHLFRTSDYGTTWQNVSNNLPNSPANAIVVDTRQNPAILYVGMDAGVFWSGDGGASWQNTSIGLPATIVHDLVLDTGSANQLIAATFGRGWWKTPPIGTTGATGPAHDSFESARAAASLPYADTGVATAAATTQAGEDIDPSCSEFLGNTVWYRYTPDADVTVTADTTGSDFDTVLVAYRGTSLAGLTEVGCDDDTVANSGPSKITSLPLTGGQTYYLQAGGWRQTADGVAKSGTLQLHVALGPPVHDQFGSARQVGAMPYVDGPVDTTGAGTQAGEDIDPSCTEFIGKTVWYRFTPGSSGKYTVETTGSTFDTVVVAHQGASLDTLAELGCDDDGVATSGPSKLTNLQLTAGQTYYRQVGGWRQTADGVAKSGSLRLRVSPVAVSNDAFAAATAISTLPYTDPGRQTSQATVEPSEDIIPSCTDGIGKTLWYRYTPAVNTTVTADTAGSTFDTVLVVYRGTSLAALTEVGCNDDGIASSGPSKIVSLQLTGGQTYYFQVGGWKSATGTAYDGTLQFHLAVG